MSDAPNIEAHTETPESGLPFSKVMPIVALTFVDVLGLTVLLPLLHLYAINYGATPLQIGLVLAVFPLAQLIGVPMMGALSDRFGRKPLLLISQVTTCLSFVMLAFATSLEMIILSRILDGIFGANLATAQAAMTDITDEKNRAQGLGLTGAAFGVGFVFGPAISLLTLEITDNLMFPALTAAMYSFISILITLFIFQETLPPEKRGRVTNSRTVTPYVIVQMLKIKGTPVLLLMLFAEQLVFFGFESLMGLFTLSRLGLLGQGNSFLFLFIGIVLVMIQARYIGKWVKKYGERKLIVFAMVMLTVGLFLVATTPEQPHPFYVSSLAKFDVAEQSINSTEAVLGNLNIQFPADGNNGIGGILWFLVATIPLSIGAALIRPNINAMLTKRVQPDEYGSILGVSASFASAANALAPILFGLMFQQFGATLPFLVGSGFMALIAFVAYLALPKDTIKPA
jgi:MFS transporter, DHA1 family, tetracycline resistance protein